MRKLNASVLKWDVKSRYTINPIILDGKNVNQSAVFDFLNFAEFVNSTLTNHIIPKL